MGLAALTLCGESREALRRRDVDRGGAKLLRRRAPRGAATARGRAVLGSSSGTPSATSAARLIAWLRPSVARAWRGASRSQGWGPARPARVAHDRPRRWRCRRERSARGADGRRRRLVAALSLRRVGRRRVVFALMGAIVAAGLTAGGVAFRKSGLTNGATAEGTSRQWPGHRRGGARRLLRIFGRLLDQTCVRRQMFRHRVPTSREPRAARASKTCFGLLIRTSPDGHRVRE